jgi:DNA-binding transcriptional regulator YdaS (Cro superfamily)
MLLFVLMNLPQYFQHTNRSKADFARAIGVSSAVLYQWLKGIRPVAIRHCQIIESETQGLVTRKDLRDGDWQKIWPELATEDSQSSMQHISLHQ